MCKCKNCNKDTGNVNNIRLSENDGFCSSSFSVSICDECLKHIMFMNSYGFTFIKIKDKLYMQDSIFGCYEEVHSKEDIERAFNPEKYEFYEWLNKKL